jgi:hypothetical protein
MTHVVASGSVLKRTPLAGWALWWTVVLASNLTDAAKCAGLVGESWTFASGNYRSISDTTARYGPPAWVNGVLFGAVICWEALATLLFWHACWAGRAAAYAAFTVGLALWLAFLVAAEVCLAYGLEETHLRLFIARRATFLAIDLIPDSTEG